MRILIALRDKRWAKKISDIFTAAGNIAEIIDHDAEHVQDQLKYTGTPYNLLIRSPDLAVNKNSTLAELIGSDKNQELPKTSPLNIFTPKEGRPFVLRKAYAAVCLSKFYPPGGVIQAGDIVLDLWQKSVRIKEETIILTQLEYKILEALCLNRGQFLGVKNLVDYIYPADTPLSYPDDVIRHKIVSLKKKLGAPTHEAIINQKGLGYKIDDPAFDQKVQISFGSLTMNITEARLERGNAHKHLTKVEMDILKALSDQQVCSRSSLSPVSDDSLNVHISRLRKKMSALDEQVDILTIYGKGYQLIGAPSPLTHPTYRPR